MNAQINELHNWILRNAELYAQHGDMKGLAEDFAALITECAHNNDAEDFLAPLMDVLADNHHELVATEG